MFPSLPPLKPLWLIFKAGREQKATLLQEFIEKSMVSILLNLFSGPSIQLSTCLQSVGQARQTPWVNSASCHQGPHRANNEDVCFPGFSALFPPPLSYTVSTWAALGEALLGNSSSTIRRCVDGMMEIEGTHEGEPSSPMDVTLKRQGHSGSWR
jgi:hypothetical protein